MRTNIKILVSLNFLCVWGIMAILLFFMEYQALAMSMHPEIFMEYNWRTLPELIRVNLQAEIYPMVSIVSVLFIGSIVTLVVFVVGYALVKVISKR